MRKIENGFADYYYLTEAGEVFSLKSNKFIKISKTSYKLRTLDNSSRTISLKELYMLVYGKVFCVDEITDIQGEIWKIVKDTNNQYYVSNYRKN